MPICIVEDTRRHILLVDASPPRQDYLPWTKLFRFGVQPRRKISAPSDRQPVQCPDPSMLVWSSYCFHNSDLVVMSARTRRQCPTGIRSYSQCDSLQNSLRVDIAIFTLVFVSLHAYGPIVVWKLPQSVLWGQGYEASPSSEHAHTTHSL